MKRKTINLDKLYVDQAIRSSTYGDRNIFSAYTPWGIRQLDSYYGNLIRTLPNKLFATKLRKEIKNNPHLHKKIKENLLFNLDNYRKEITSENQRKWDEAESLKPRKGKKVRILTGYNKDTIGVVTWYEESPMGTRLGVTSDSPKFSPYLLSKERNAFYNSIEVEVINL